MCNQISTWSNPSEALYPNLVEDYLAFFLPADGKVVPSIPQMASPVRSPIAYQSPNYRYIEFFSLYNLFSYYQFREKKRNWLTGNIKCSGKIYIVYFLRAQSQGAASPGSSFSRLHMSTLFKNLSPAQRTAPQTNIPNVDVIEQPETWRSQTFLQVTGGFSFVK